MTTLKEQLYLLCSQYISNREAAAKTMIADVREAVANETKSSAGDKYETSREMMQQEIEQHMARLNELHKMRTILQHISTTHSAATVTPGAVVYTNNGNYYIAISAGQLTVDGTNYYAISAASPIGTQLIGKTAGATIILNGKSFVVEKVV
jgi:transcription elongation GreA/GreB family factor